MLASSATPVSSLAGVWLATAGAASSDAPSTVTVYGALVLRL